MTPGTSGLLGSVSWNRLPTSISTDLPFLWKISVTVKYLAGWIFRSLLSDSLKERWGWFNTRPAQGGEHARPRARLAAYVPLF